MAKQISPNTNDEIVAVPAFSVQDDRGRTWTQEDLRGKLTVLYFYPKDNTPGCTREALEFREESLPLNVQILGVSKDSIASHCSFRDKYQLNFPLLSDIDTSLCKKFKVWKKKSMYGRESVGIERSTFLIGPDLQIVQAWRKVKVEGHVQEVLAAVRGYV